VTPAATETLPDPSRLIAIFETIPHCQDLGMKVIELRPGIGFMSLDYDERLIGNPKTGHVHGGVITSLLDTICGLAAISAVPATAGVSTLDLRIDYLKPATPGETIRATAECYRRTSNVVFVRGLAYHDHVGDPIANSVGTFMLGPSGFAIVDAEKKQLGKRR